MRDEPFQLATESRRRKYLTLLLWLSYLGLAIVLTWPVLLHLTTHLPGDGGDDPAIAWNLWWIKYALLNEPQNPFVTDFIFYPLGINLAFYTLTLLNGLTALPLTLNFGVVTASNLHMLFTFVGGGYGTFLLVRYILAGAIEPEPANGGRLIWIGAAVAGAFYAFAGSKLFYVALGQFNIASNHWIPLAVLYIVRTHHRPGRLKNPVLAGLFLTLQTWAEMTYASFLVVFIGLYWLYWLLVREKGPTTIKRNEALAYLRAAGVMGATFVLGISPILAQMVPDLLAEGDFLVEGGGFADAFSADLFGFIIPTMHHPLLGRLVTQTGITNFTKGQHIYVGLVLLGLLAISGTTGYRHRRLRFWLLATVAFALLSLGPVITIDGQSTGIPGPFILLQELPFFKGNRYPSRYSVMLLLSLSVLAGFGLVQLLDWLGHRSKIQNSSFIIHHSIPPLILLLFLFEHLSLPLPQSDMRVPAPYRIITGAPGDFTLLEIPLAWRNGFRITGPPTTQFMFGQFYQTAHQKKLLQGNTSRNPAFKFQYFTAAPVINSLLALEAGQTLPAERWAGDQAIAAEVLRFFNIRYVVVRPYQYTRFDGLTVTEQAAIPYIEATFPVEKIVDEPAIKIYRVAESVPPETNAQSNLRIDTAGSLAPLYFGEGWGWLEPGQPIAAQRKRVRLLLPLTGSPQRLSLRARLPQAYQGDSQSVALELNGWQSSPQPVNRNWQELFFNLPAGVAHPGLNELVLHFDRVATLSPVVPETSLLDVTALSAGEEVGDFGQIFVNGQNVSPNRRGYNVALIQPGGDILAVASFDTHLNPAASTALADFVAAAPAEATVAVAAADEASANLGEEAVLALQALGATGDLRGCFRCSHAFIRPSTGAPVEMLARLRPAGVTTSLGLTEPKIGAVVEWIRVESITE